MWELEQAAKHKKHLKFKDEEERVYKGKKKPYHYEDEEDSQEIDEYYHPWRNIDKSKKFSTRIEETHDLMHDLRDVGDEMMEYIEEIKHEDPKLFCKLKCHLWKAIYGPHFVEKYIMEALEKMAKAYGKTEIKYTLKEAENLAIKYGFKTSDFNPCDWCYALNLIHFMFGQHTANNPEQEVKLAFHWMHDKTLPEGKPFHHYHTMLKVEGEDE